MIVKIRHQKLASQDINLYLDGDLNCYYKETQQASREQREMVEYSNRYMEAI